jgi:hypothetical protein
MVLGLGGPTAGGDRLEPCHGFVDRRAELDEHGTELVARCAGVLGADRDGHRSNQGLVGKTPVLEVTAQRACAYREDDVVDRHPDRVLDLPDVIEVDLGQ